MAPRRAFRPFPPGAFVVLGALTGCNGDLISRPLGEIPRVVRVVVLPDSATLDSGDTLRLGVVLIDAFGDTVERPVMWTSSDTLVARVDAGGLVRAVTPGRANIVATREDVSGRAAITVTSPARAAEEPSARLARGLLTADG